MACLVAQPHHADYARLRSSALFYEAVDQGDVASMMEHVASVEDVNYKRLHYPFSPLSVAIFKGCDALVRVLLEHGAVTPPCGALENCRVCMAIRGRWLGCLQVLLEFGAPRCLKHKSGLRDPELDRVFDNTHMVWRPERHWRADHSLQATVLTVMVLRTLVPTLVDIPPEVMYMVFELLPYC